MATALFPRPEDLQQLPNLPAADGEDTIDRRLEFDLAVLPTLPAADLLDAGQVDRVVTVDSEEPVGQELLDEGA